MGLGSWSEVRSDHKMSKREPATFLYFKNIIYNGIFKVVNVYGSMYGFQLQLLCRTPAWSAELILPVPYGTRNWTGTQDWSSAWRKNSRARITSRAHPRTIKWHLHNPALHLLDCAFLTRYPSPRTRENIQRPKHIRFRDNGRQRRDMSVKIR